MRQDWRARSVRRDYGTRAGAEVATDFETGDAVAPEAEDADPALWATGRPGTLRGLRRGLRRGSRQNLLALGAALLILLLLRDRFTAIDLGAVAAAFGQVTAARWLAALAATAVGFWAVGHYDLVLHATLAPASALVRPNAPASPQSQFRKLWASA